MSIEKEVESQSVINGIIDDAVYEAFEQVDNERIANRLLDFLIASDPLAFDLFCCADEDVPSVCNEIDKVFADEINKLELRPIERVIHNFCISGFLDGIIFAKKVTKLLADRDSNDVTVTESVATEFVEEVN